ncbi:hypothetical protein [Pseudomonas sp. GCEP-101]|uniref:hypothetical protein n=1 Tax=Pseudomonas sp. GCEP-101 TaxID=2974552 RepID=UPI00223C1793|nr:hypothetical protein [Pseudomonas sp. GCEP-101]
MSTVCRNGMEDAFKALEGLQNVLQGLTPVSRQPQPELVAQFPPSAISPKALPATLRATVARLPKVAAAGLLTAASELSASTNMLELEYRAGATQGRMLAAVERDELREDECQQLSDWILSLTMQRSLELKEHL